MERRRASWIWLCRSKKPASSPKNSSRVLVRGRPNRHMESISTPLFPVIMFWLMLLVLGPPFCETDPGMRW